MCASMCTRVYDDTDGGVRQLAPHMLSDHRGASYLSALKATRAAMTAISPPPAWQPYHAAGDKCACCAAPFTWEHQGAASEWAMLQSANDDGSLGSQALQACARHNCRACGRVVCDACSQQQQCLPQFGIIEPVRCCDACFFKA